MKLIRFDAIAPFSQQAEAFLLEDEARHNLILGLSTELKPNLYLYGDQQPYLATVADDTRVVAAALMTPPYKLTLSLATSPGAFELIAADLATLYPTLPGVTGPDDVALRFAEQWQRQSGQHFDLVRSMCIYQLTAVRPVVGVPGSLRRATLADRELLTRWVAAFYTETGTEPHSDAAAAEQAVTRWLSSEGRVLYLWEDGEAVSMAGFGGRTPNGVRVGPVYTPPERRGRGYASALVAAASQMQLDSGRRYCFLFTDLANPTSNHIYQQIGYTPVCDVSEYDFAPLAQP